MHKKNQKYIVILLVVFISMITFTMSSVTNQRITDIEEGNRFDGTIQDSAPHAAIYIDMNWTAAEALGICTGSGTEEDPWVIKDYIIDAGGSGSGIFINNSNDFFRIIDCTITGAGLGSAPDYEAGIRLFNVTNGLIYNNNVSNNEVYNIELRNAHNNTIYNNIIGNTNSINGFAGVYVVNSTSNYFIENSLDSNRLYSFWLKNCNNSHFIGNSIDAVSTGIYASISSNNNSIEDNRISGASVNAMYFTNSNYNFFKKNKLYSSGLNGLELNDSDYNEIIYNRFDGIGGIGLLLDTTSTLSNDNTVFKNYFTGITGNNVEDNGANNAWNHTWVGNYYDDYVDLDVNDDGICDNNFTIPGTAGTVDILPIYGNPFHDGSPIFINGTQDWGNTSWYWVFQRAWCTGLNTPDDPLIIEDLIINAQNSSNGLEIINSDLPNIYAIIENCTVYNSTDILNAGGIVLKDTESIIIRDCNVSNNGRRKWNFWNLYIPIELDRYIQ